jgi:hypothetical protein
MKRGKQASWKLDLLKQQNFLRRKYLKGVYEMDICFPIIFLGILIYGIYWQCVEEPKERKKEEAYLRYQEEKRARFMLWYNSLTQEEKILCQLERQNQLLEEQADRQTDLAGLIATGNLINMNNRWLPPK